MQLALLCRQDTAQHRTPQTEGFCISGQTLTLQGWQHTLLHALLCSACSAKQTPCHTSTTQPLPDAATHLQDQHALLHQRVVVQVCTWREHQQVWQQLIHTHLIAPVSTTTAAAVTAAVLAPGTCTLQLRQDLLHVCFEKVDARMPGVRHGRLLLRLLLQLGPRLLLLLGGRQPTCSIL